MQAVTPLFWGPMSDTLGRRPTYIASFAVYIVGNVALSFSPNYAVLLIFRGVQAAGSASTVSIGMFLSFPALRIIINTSTDQRLQATVSCRT